MLAVGWGKRVFLWKIQFLSAKMGIRREFSCRYTPEKNRIAERKNRSIVEAAVAMLKEKSMPMFYLTEAI